MQAREFLEQYRIAQARANRLEKKLDQLKEEYASVHGGIVYTSHGSEINKPTERKVEKAQAAFDRWAAAQLDAVEIRQEIFAVISAIEDSKLSDLLWYRYLGLFSWPDVSDAVGVCRGTALKMHRQGLEIIQQKIDNR